ncbi:MAG: hypothetical protein K2X71_10295 [Methylobacterium sp.]|uniref:hypothetical protein n=1 Tax=Methylobacterium sp. TaxID=409 RepID=UPI00258D2A61|nr:hypothetical protein [Methylobacterium sp.]MBY0296415.1 hypothetical protein [Methylobacterium sp.]
MHDARKFGTTQACHDILAEAAEILRSSRRSDPIVTVEQGLRLALETMLADLVSLYICDPASIGDDEEAARILNRILIELSNLDEQRDSASHPLQ